MSKTFRTAKEVDAAKVPGLYSDQGQDRARNLYLQVAKTGSNPVTKSWVFRFMMDGKPDYMGLGSYPLVTLAEARDAAIDARRLMRQGINPRVARDARKAAKKLEAARAITFKEFAEGYITAHEPGWRNEKHRDQWKSTLKTYVYPVFGELPLPAVNTDLVLKAIEPDWQTKTESMNRIRGRIEKILDAAKTRGLRDGENPARWVGHLKELLPARKRLQKIKHHPSLPYAAAPDFMAKLRQRDSIAAAALEFAILTASRTSEVIAARWVEFDLRAKIWTVPADRIKGGREHRVPLSPAALAIIKKMQGGHKDFVFPGYRGKHLGDNAMLTLLDRMGHGDVTTHGMRSTFRTWAGEQTSFPRELAELALAHINDDATEAAYLRTDYFEKRRELMNLWARFLAGDSEPIRLVASAE